MTLALVGDPADRVGAGLRAEDGSRQGQRGLAVERAFASHARRGFQNVVGAARVAVGVDRDLLQQVAGRGQFQRLEAAFQ